MPHITHTNILTYNNVIIIFAYVFGTFGTHGSQPLLTADMSADGTHSFVIAAADHDQPPPREKTERVILLRSTTWVDWEHAIVSRMSRSKLSFVNEIHQHTLYIWFSLGHNHRH